MADLPDKRGRVHRHLRSESRRRRGDSVSRIGSPYLKRAMHKSPLPSHLLRVEWQLLHMAGSFEQAIARPEVRRTLESSARAREARELRRQQERGDVKRRASGDYDD